MQKKRRFTKRDMESYGCCKEDLIKYYAEGNETIRSLSKIYGVSATIVSEWLMENDIKYRKYRHKYKINNEYFKIIDTEEKAYWLGFIWCDGYIGSKDNGENGFLQYSFELTLNQRDIEHLEKLNRDLESTYKIKSIKNINSKSKDEHKVSLRVSRNEFCEVLVDKYGFIPWRTSIEKIKLHLRDEFIKHFIRGVIDANGSFCEYADNYNKKTDIQMSIASRSLELLDFIQDYLIINDLQKRRKKIYDEKDSDCFSLHIKGVKQTPKILKHLYSDSKVYLDRKHKKYIDIINKIDVEGGYNARTEYSILMEQT